jgi:tRNA A-37 threonylcarbamoyl transferase component Bud32
MQPGQRIDKYRISRLLKKGGMAAVYLVEHELLQKTMALKILPPELGSDQAYVERFLREARAAASLDHPRIIRIHDVGCSDQLYYIAMDLIEGPTLRAVIRERAPLPTNEILDISEQVLAALSVAHDKQIIHRDLKPQNIMFNRQGEIVVMDFGIAKAADDVDLTRTGMFIGTARYASPEQIKGQAVDIRCDIYAWALVMFEMATGKQPERFTTPRPEALRPHTSANLAAVIEKALAQNPADRYANADEMRAALNTIATGDTTGHTRTPLGTLPPETLTSLQLPVGHTTIAIGSPATKARPWYRRKLALALFAAAGISILVSSAWWLMAPSLRQPPKVAVATSAGTTVSMAAQDLNVWADKPTYRVGEAMRLYYRSTRDGYLFLFHQGADGSTEQIFPLASTDDNYITAQLTYTLPDPSHNFKYVASPPGGEDRILAHMTADRDEALAWQARQIEGNAPPLEALTEKLVLTVTE